jgi:hypothetical protein
MLLFIYSMGTHLIPVEYHGEKIKDDKLILMPCKTLNHRCYQNQALLDFTAQRHKGPYSSNPNGLGFKV